MITLLHPAWREGESLGEYLQKGGMANRRDFLKFCGRMAGLFALSPLLPGEAHATAEQVAATLAAMQKPNVVWLQLQECTGC
ncbi:MAG TPA: twin-arginine translocation signal domain-containing protein, partial [Candidatus Krumholzibacteriaceae bacterium]|nr:twin-arginine translocation signal domain-containing protein [Candidatus Krumholzibacteriaceae bacterium]